jgi:2'-5' RNA ligase
METIRSFIAIELPTGIQAEFGRVIQLLSPAGTQTPVRWMTPQNIHLTLKFLGDIKLSGVNQLKDALKQECRRHGPFEIRVGTLGAFPNIHRPRVIWIGVQAPPELAALQQGIETSLLTLGYPPEDRQFSPHLTLGRVSQQVRAVDIDKLSSLLTKTRVGLLGIHEVRSVLLIRSDLRPTGPIYTKLSEVILNVPA